MTEPDFWVLDRVKDGWEIDREASHHGSRNGDGEGRAGRELRGLDRAACPDRRRVPADVAIRQGSL
jgi:hypothetical protein